MQPNPPTPTVSHEKLMKIVKERLAKSQAEFEEAKQQIIRENEAKGQPREPTRTECWLRVQQLDSKRMDELKKRLDDAAFSALTNQFAGATFEAVEKSNGSTVEGRIYDKRDVLMAHAGEARERKVAQKEPRRNRVQKRQYRPKKYLVDVDAEMKPEFRGRFNTNQGEAVRDRRKLVERFRELKLRRHQERELEKEKMTFDGLAEQLGQVGLDGKKEEDGQRTAKSSTPFSDFRF